eukprot:6182325-Pleurochrysis_carterae.AAC.5
MAELSVHSWSTLDTMHVGCEGVASSSLRKVLSLGGTQTRLCVCQYVCACGERCGLLAADRLPLPLGHVAHATDDHLEDGPALFAQQVDLVNDHQGHLRARAFFARVGARTSSSFQGAVRMRGGDRAAALKPASSLKLQVLWQSLRLQVLWRACAQQEEREWLTQSCAAKRLNNQILSQHSAAQAMAQRPKRKTSHVRLRGESPKAKRLCTG